MFHYNITYTQKEQDAIKVDYSGDVLLKDLPSNKIKRYENGKVIFNTYNDMENEKKLKIKSLLKSLSKSMDKKKFFENIVDLAKKNRYFIQTDIIGAFYNISYKTLFQKISYLLDEETFIYLLEFYDYIHLHYEKDDYLYISCYSEELFKLYLNEFFKDLDVIYKMDDILFYDNDIDILKKMMKNAEKKLNISNLYFNETKTQYIDTMFNSIYIFKTIVTVPKCNILDKNIRDLIEKASSTDKIINVYNFSDIYSYIKHLEGLNDSCKFIIKYYINVPIWTKIKFMFVNYFYKTDNVINDLIYNGFGESLDKKQKKPNLSNFNKNYHVVNDDSDYY